IMAAGGIDLSVGSLLAMCAIVSGIFFRDAGCPMPLAIIVGALAGLCGGMLNGLASAYLRVPALVVTLATMSLFRGVALGLSQAQPVSSFPSAWTLWGGSSFLPLGRLQLPSQVLVLLIFVVAGEFILHRTRLGRWAMQIGENETA